MSATETIPANDLRLELRVRNNVLWHLIFDSSKSVAEFCRERGYSQYEVGGFLNLTRTPYLANGEPRPMAQRIADDSRLLVEDLFPKDIYGGRFPRIMSAEIPSQSFRSLSAAKKVALPPMQEDAILNQEAKVGIETVLSTLTPRESECIRMRFGLSGQDEHTLEEVASKFGVSRMRVCQIEAKALRKMRHRSRIKHLEPLTSKRDAVLPVIDTKPYETQETQSFNPPPRHTTIPFVYVTKEDVKLVGQDAVDALLREGEELLRSFGDKTT